MTSSTKDTADHTAEPSAEHTIDIHTTAGKLADLRKRAEETLHPVGEKAVEKVHAKGKLTARERILALLDEDSFVELDALAKHRSVNFGLAGEPPARRRRGHRLRHHRRPRRLHLQPGRDGVRRQPRRGVRREDRQGAGAGAQDRPPADRHQRRRGRPHPRGCRLTWPVQQHLSQQHPGLGRHPADLADHGRRGGRPRLLPRADRLRRHGRPDQPDVHHRARRHQDRHRRRGDDGGARRRAHPHGQVGPGALRRLRRAGRLRLRPRPAELPAEQQLLRAAAVSGRGRPRAPSRTPSPTRTSSWTR